MTEDQITDLWKRLTRQKAGGYTFQEVDQLCNMARSHRLFQEEEAKRIFSTPNYVFDPYGEKWDGGPVH